MKTFLTTFLEEQGLNAKDIRVYLDVYAYGQSYASSVAARTHIDRTTVYAVLKRLMKRSLIIRTKSHNVRAYMAVNPQVFIDHIDRDIESLKTQKKSASLFLDEISKIKRLSFLKPGTKIFEGTEAIKNLYLHTLEKNRNQKAFLSIDTIPTALKDFLKKEFIKLKVAKKVVSKVLVAETPFARRYKALDEPSNRETQIIKKYPFNLHSEIILCNDREVALIDFREDLYGILIESETLYKTMETLFDYIWMSEYDGL